MDTTQYINYWVRFIWSNDGLSILQPFKYELCRPNYFIHIAFTQFPTALTYSARLYPIYLLILSAYTHQNE